MKSTESMCLSDIFERQVDRAPNAQALSCRDQMLTYQALDEQSNQLAHYLKDLGAGPGMLIGLHFSRSEKPIIAILAVLKAGAAYVPLDPCFPVERCRHIVSEAEIEILITERTLADSAAQFFDGKLLVVEAEFTRLASYPRTRILRTETGLTTSDLCYVLYTSGTTGRPKGVMTEHRHVARFIHAFHEVCRLTPQDRIYHGFALGFDGSVEEMWMAFASGACLYVGTDEMVKVGSEVARFINEKQLTFFSTVPTFLSMIPRDLPSVRVLIVSGEVCSQALVDKWGIEGCRMLNVYGPTETTVNATVAECRAGVPVTIGCPLAGYELVLLDEQQQPVPKGEWGELYIGGGTLARGYLNQSTLTAHYFISNPWAEDGASRRLYRTGDRVRWNEQNKLEFQGRIDSQVKIRGFRIELTEIESVLCEHLMIDQAVVTVFNRQGVQQLAAYVVLQNGNPLDRSHVLKHLQERLPAYMLPFTLDVIDAIPTLNSGKVDRTQLPEPESPLFLEDHEIVPPQNNTQKILLTVWQVVFNISSISIKDDFFLDLGGHSLLAAQMVSKLRQDAGMTVALRDVYRFPTIEQLAAQVIDSEEACMKGATSVHSPESRQSSRDVFNGLSKWVRRLTVLLQTLSLYGLYGWTTILIAGCILVWLGVWQEKLPLKWGIWTSVTLVVGMFPLKLLIVVIAKWLIIGRYKPGRHAVGGIYYWRWWVVNRLQVLCGAGALAGTPLMSLFYRLMGAKVGSHCLIDTAHCCCFDLITIGEESSINAQTQLLGYRIENGELCLGSVTIGKRCFVGIHSVLGLNTCMEDNSSLDDLSLLEDHQTIPLGSGYRGSPAHPEQVSLPEVTSIHLSSLHPVSYGFLHLFALEFLHFLLLFSLIPSLLAACSGWLWYGFVGSVVAAMLAIPFDIVFYCLWVGLLKRIILHRTPPGIYSVYTWFYLRKWLVDSLMRISRQRMHALYTTIYLPSWLRLLGACIGKRAEISTVSQVSPDLVDIADESFFADGSIIGGRHFYCGHVYYNINRIGYRSFVGNNAILPVGRHLGDRCLLGVLSVPPVIYETTPTGSDWLGSPSFRLPHRQKVDGFDESVTFKPTPKLYVQRLIIDGLRILMPAWLAGGGVVLFFLFLWLGQRILAWPMLLLLTPLVSLLITVIIAMAVVGLKWLIMGRIQPVIKPLWCTYVWWNEAVNGLHETIAVPLLSPLIGTPYLAWYLRGLGCKIGKHCFMGTTLFSEFDLVDIGDYVALNEGVVVQNHLFEDRIMKSSYVHIADDCNVGNMAIILYDTEVQNGVTIAPLSLLMKGETLMQGSRWHGIPTRSKQTGEILMMVRP